MPTQKEVLVQISNQLNGLKEIKEEIANLRSSVTFLMNRMNFVEETIRKLYEERKKYETEMMKRDQFLIDRAIEINEAAGIIESKANGIKTNRKKSKRIAASG